MLQMRILTTRLVRQVSHSLYRSCSILLFLELIVPCCDLCILKKVADGQIPLTPAEADPLLLYNRIHSREVLAVPANNGAARQIDESSDDDLATSTADLHHQTIPPSRSSPE